MTRYNYGTNNEKGRESLSYYIHITYVHIKTQTQFTDAYLWH